MSSIAYFTRSRKKGDKEISIWIRVHHCGSDFRQSLPLSVPARFWNKKRGWIRDTVDDPCLKERLDKTGALLNNLKHHIYSFLIGRGNMTNSDLKLEINSFISIKHVVKRKEDNNLFTIFITNKISSMENKSFLNRGEPYSKNAINNWKKFLTLWKAYESNIYGKALRFRDITIDTYYQFMDYCDKNMYRKSTKYQYARLFKAALNYALTDGVSTNLTHHHRNFSTHSYSETNKGVYLTMNEIVKLIQLEFQKNDFKDKVRDYFLIGCLTGLRFSDCSSISINDIVHFELNGCKHSALIKTQKKTKNEVAIPLLTKDVERILLKYGGKMPKISISGYNKYIKDICRIAGIVEKVRTTNIVGGKEVVKWVSKDRLVSSHTARRTCITNLYLSGKLDMKQIRDISGHKSEQAFSRYICLSQEENVKTIIRKLVQ